MAANPVPAPVTADLAQLQQDVTTMVATHKQLEAQVQELQGHLDATKQANPDVDLTAIDAAIQQMHHAIQAANDNVQTAAPVVDQPPTPVAADQSTQLEPMPDGHAV